MDDKGLDTASAQPAGQPESIPAGLESQNDPSDHSTAFHRTIPPTLHQTQQRRWIGIQFLQGSSFNARNKSGGEPACLAHLQHYNHGAILLEGDQRTAQVINLGHGGTSIGFRTTTTVPDLCRRPHSFWTRTGRGPNMRIPIYSGRVFRREAGHRSDLKPATIPK